MKNVRMGVLSAWPLFSCRLNSGSRNGSQPPQATISGVWADRLASAVARDSAPGSLTERAAARVSVAGPIFSESTSWRPNCVTDGVPAPASRSSAGLSDLRFTGTDHAAKANAKPANATKGAVSGFLTTLAIALMDREERRVGKE